MNESYHTYEWVMLHIWMSQLLHRWVQIARRSPPQISAKRAVCIRIRAVYLCKRASCSHKSACYVQLSGDLCMSSKQPGTFTKEPCKSAKEPCVLATEDCMSAKEAHTSAKQAHISAKESMYRRAVYTRKRALYARKRSPWRKTLKTCSALQHTATHCNTLQHTTTHCNTLQHTAKHCNTLQHTATHCETLSLTAKQCNTLQHTATHCNTMHHAATWQHKRAVQRSQRHLWHPPRRCARTHSAGHTYKKRPVFMKRKFIYMYMK